MDSNEIKLTELLRLPNPQDFKLHLATPSDGEHPLDAYVRDRSDWIRCNEQRDPRKNDWTRPFILSFIEFPPVPGTHLFGGAFKVASRRDDGYELKDLDAFSKWEGRLVCTFHRCKGMRGRAFYLENFLDQFSVHQVLPKQYHGEAFCG